MADKEALQQFEAQLLKELEKRGFILERFIEGGFRVSRGKDNTALEIRPLRFYSMHQEGKGISEIVDMLIPAKGGMQIDLKKVYPIVKDGTFVYNTLHDMGGEKGIRPDDPGYLVFLLRSEEDNLYVLCGFDSGDMYFYLQKQNLASLGMDEKKLYELSIKNLMKKIDGFIEKDEIVITKQGEGAYSLNLPEDFAASFILVASGYFDFLQKKMGMETRELIAFIVTSDEILLCHPDFAMPRLTIIQDVVRNRQKELAGFDSRKKSISLGAILIRRDGWSFIPP